MIVIQLKFWVDVDENCRSWYTDGLRDRKYNQPSDIWEDGYKCWCYKGRFLKDNYE